MSEWISVKDRLPESPMVVLVYCPDYTNYEEPLIVKWIEGKEGMMFWDFDELSDRDITEDVTHWMPIPDLPTTLPTDSGVYEIGVNEGEVFANKIDL